jgi:tRNA pseudouridine55 synthase
MDGVLVMDKPAGLTSHDVVACVRRILDERRVGHSGTLDPFATGVLVILVGRATRLAQFLSIAEKEYQAVIRLGYATDTGDLTGRPLFKKIEGNDMKAAGPPSEEEIASAIQGLLGEIDQVPPMYSAKKSKGRKLYELARRGETVERQPVRVTIHELQSLRLNSELLRQNQDGTIDLGLRVVCSAGTYIRTLAEALGERLGAGAHLAELRRTRVGDFALQNAISLEKLRQVGDEGSLRTVLLTPYAALPRMPFVHLNADGARRAGNGMPVPITVYQGMKWSEGQQVRMRDEKGNLIAVGSYDPARQLLQPRVVIGSEQ